MLVPIVTNAVLNIIQEGKSIDLHMVEIMHMIHRQAKDSRLVNGIVMDHGGRHPDMPSKLSNCFILTCNVSLEYEKTEVHSGFYFTNAEQRDRLIASERTLTDERCMKIIELKRKVCLNGEGFVVINQKGIDPVCLDMFAKEGILALRRAKRRNMERLMLACGGVAVNGVDELSRTDLGWAGKVTQEELGEEKFTFVEDCKNPKSVTVLLKGPDDHTIAILKDAVRDGLRAVTNTINDKAVVPGAGAFEIYAFAKLVEFKDTVEGKAKLGIQAYAEAMLIIPKILAQNSGFDAQDSVILLLDEFNKNKVPVGLDLWNYGVVSPDKMGIFDNYIVKKTFIDITTTLSEQLLLCDEILKAGKKMGGNRDEDAPAPGPCM
jgi:T-complex protein 1 subunit zeta